MDEVFARYYSFNRIGQFVSSGRAALKLKPRHNEVHKLCIFRDAIDLIEFYNECIKANAKVINGL